MRADPIWDDPFHTVAFADFVQQAKLQADWPDREKIRQRAYRLFEEGLAARPTESGEPERREQDKSEDTD